MYYFVCVSDGFNSIAFSCRKTDALYGQMPKILKYTNPCDVSLYLNGLGCPMLQNKNISFKSNMVFLRVICNATFEVLKLSE